MYADTASNSIAAEFARHRVVLVSATSILFRYYYLLLFQRHSQIATQRHLWGGQTGIAWGDFIVCG